MQLCKNAKVRFLPYFIEFLVPSVLQLIAPTQREHDRQMALCMFDDVVEHSGHEAVVLFPQFLPFVLNYAIDIFPPVRQAAVYGIGVCAQFGREHFVPVVPDALARLNNVIAHGESRNEKNVNATENAISAVGKILQYQTTDLNQLLPVWLSYLPVTEDLLEAIIIYEKLCYFIENHNQAIFGQHNQNILKILAIFADVHDTCLITEPIKRRMTAILKQLQSSLPNEMLGKLWAGLSTEQQHKLTQLAAFQ